MPNSIGTTPDDEAALDLLATLLDGLTFLSHVPGEHHLLLHTPVSGELAQCVANSLQSPGLQITGPNTATTTGRPTADTTISVFLTLTNGGQQ